MAKFGGTRFTKAATPLAGGTANLSNRIIGGNARKQKLTEAAGTNPSKMGGGSMLTKKPSVGDVGDRRYAQDTAPYKTQNPYDFSVGGPGFPKPMK